MGLLAGPAFVVLASLLFCLPGMRWGLPSVTSWSQDTIAGMRTIGHVLSTDGRRGRYGPMHYELLYLVYRPVLAAWEADGSVVIDRVGGQVQFKDRDATTQAILLSS
ncbi:MAG: hypothetical protein ACPGXK_15660, partial [Phycisphaerae bacterium]